VSKRPTWNNQGRLFVLSAPSGCGKTTVLRHLMKGQKNAVRSISVTTRPQRPGERNGRDYWFWSEKRFLEAIRRKEWLEWAKVLGHRYGTLRRPVERAIQLGKDVFLSIDVQGARTLRRSGLPVTTIFLVPPSMKVLEERLRRRKTETPKEIAQRLELAKKEMAKQDCYDYVVVNDNLRKTVEALRAIVQAEKWRRQPSGVRCKQ